MRDPAPPSGDFDQDNDVERAFTKGRGLVIAIRLKSREH